MFRALLCLSIVALTWSPALACRFGTCRSCRAKVVEQVYVPQAINYFVGAPIRVEAIVQKELRADPLYLEFLQFKARRAEAEGETEVGGETENDAPLLSALRQSCGRCHGGATPKAQLVLDGSAPLDAVVITEALRQISTGQMPPESAGSLSPADKGAIMRELLSLERRRE